MPFQRQEKLLHRLAVVAKDWLAVHIALAKEWLGTERTHNVIKALVSCLIATLLITIAPVRQALGPYGFNVLVVAGWTHGGTTIGAHIELQAQQLLVSAGVWAYMALAQLLVFGVANIPAGSLETRVYGIRAVLLAVFCFLIALVNAYVPRLSVPVKLNVIAPLSALTIFPAQDTLHFPTMPSIIYAQLLGVGISLVVNLLVLPSTSSCQLARCLEDLAGEMAECCGLVGRHIDGLAFALTGQAVERARERRRAVRAAATRLAEATGSVRYEVLIGVFSQADYQEIFIEANKAAASFGALCLPFEIDQTVVRELCKTGAGSFDFGSQNRDPSERIVQAIRELLEEHQAAVAKMVRAMADIHGRSAAQEMCRIICRWVGASRPAGLDLLDLLEVARHLDDRAAHFEHLVTATIAQIPEHQILQDDLWYMHHTILLSLAGVLRENSQRTSCLLRTIGGIQSRRQGIGCVWVPRLSWEWLVRGTENLASHVQDIDHLQTAFEKSASIDHAEPVTGHSQQPAGVWAWTMQCLGNVDAWLHKRKVQYALKFTVAAMICAIWAFLSFSHAWYVQNNCHWAVICIAFVFNISIGATTSACLKRLLATCLAGAWAIAAWEISLKGASPPLAVLSTMMLCCACIAAQFYAGRSGLAPIAPVMLIAYAAVFCSAYYEKNNGQPGISGERLGWHRIVVNTIGIAFAMLVSAVLMPCRARVVLLERLAELLHLSSRIAQTTTFMHAAGADHPAAYRCAHSRLVHFLQRSRVLIARSRALHVTAQSEPNLAPARGIAACRQLIDLLETQLEWQMYAFSAYERIGQEAVTCAVRGSLGVRQDILGAFACFNYIVAVALASNRPLPEFLPDIRTARLQSLEIVRQALRAEPGFGATALCRLSVGVWHLAAGQSGILRLARDVVGSEADLLPDIVDRMALVMESGGDPDTTPVNSPLLATFNHPAPHPMQWFAHQHARHNLKL